MLLYVIFHNYEILHILEILITSCEMQLENLLNGSDWSDLSLATLALKGYKCFYWLHLNRKIKIEMGNNLNGVIIDEN